MDGRGRALDNIFVERLWRSVKHEDVYLKGYGNIADLMVGLTSYFDFYNTERPHQSLNYKTPGRVYASAAGGGVHFDLLLGVEPHSEEVGSRTGRHARGVALGLRGALHPIKRPARIARRLPLWAALPWQWFSRRQSAPS